MERVTKKKGTSFHDCGVDGAEASWQASQGEHGWKFEVFLSFRGADTRKGFTGHLHEALVQRGISTFIDNEDLEKGERVEELFRYIERSKLFVPVISKGYADSKWCLREITKIVECKRLIIPVFFGIQPSDVRNQEGPFKSAFERHENNEELKKEVSDWKNALRAVGQISGFNLEDVNCYEADLIKCILERIMKEVKSRLPDVCDYPTGLDSRVDEVIKRLGAEIGMVGICGMGGIGKTTLAKAVYHRLSSSFRAHSFLANVREATEHFNGIVGLQEQLFRDVLGSEVRVNNRDEGITLIRERIGGMEVLVVVDDVDHIEQLDALIGSRSGWFGSKSRIIVTCRDENIFNARQVVIYWVAELDPVQSLELFSQHAFGQPETPSDWRGELSEKVVSIAGGIPLCLKVFGPLFSNLESSEKWESMLDKLKNDQHKEVHVRLKISYDSLDEKTKRIFLDISCFLLGKWDSWGEYYPWESEIWEERRKKTESAMEMWEGSELYPTAAVAELQHKSLISINDEHDTFEMHDQIRDMGRNIVRQQKPSPSRFWENNETLKVLQRKQGLENIEGIIFHRPHWHYMIHLNRKSFRKMGKTPLNTMSFRNMGKLRILDLSFVRLEGPYRHLPNSVKFLRWWWCPLKSLPIDFPVDNIVVLDLTKSKIKQFLGPSVTSWWPFVFFRPQEANHSGKFSQLKVLILKDCKNLKSTPDFRLIPNATKLIFEGCTNLSQVHESIGDLQSLVCLNFKGCSSLKKIPDSICRLSSLEILNLDGCNKISTWPEKLGDLLSLTELDLGWCSQMMDVPHALREMNDMMKPQEANHLRRFSQLKVLNLKNCKNLKSTPDFRLIPNATKLIFEGCYNLGQVHESIGDLQSLVCLNLRDCCSLKQIPDSICGLSSLEILNLNHCSEISTLPEKLGDLLSLKELHLGWCSQLMGVPGLTKLRCLEHLELHSCDALRDMERMMQEAKLERYKYLSLPGRLSTSSCSESTRGVWTWSVTVSFDLPNVPHLRRVSIWVEDLVPISFPAIQVKAVRHDDSFIIFEPAEEEWRMTEPAILINVCGPFIPLKEEDEKAKAGMIRDGTRYRRIDVTFERESDLSGSSSNINLWR